MYTDITFRGMNSLAHTKLCELESFHVESARLFTTITRGTENPLTFLQVRKNQVSDVLSIAQSTFGITLTGFEKLSVTSSKKMAENAHARELF